MTLMLMPRVGVSDLNTITWPAEMGSLKAPEKHVRPPGGTVQLTFVSKRSVGFVVAPLSRTMRTPSAGAGTSRRTRRLDARQVMGATLAAPPGVVVSGPKGLSGDVCPLTVW